MNDIKYIVPGLEGCNGKCRKCSWYDRFLGKCMLKNAAAEYIKYLEADNAKKMVYCKDCIYCESEERVYKYLGSDKYMCRHRDGIGAAYVCPMDYCSKGQLRGVEVEG